MKKRMIRKGIVLGIIILFFGASVVQGVTQSSTYYKEEIQPTITDIITFNPTDDTRVSHWYPDKNYGHNTMTVVMNDYGATSSNWAYDTLTSFDISSVPSNSIINSAVLGFYYYEYVESNPAGRNLNLYKITNTWNEETVTWNTQPNYAAEPTTFTPVPSSPGNWMEWDVTVDVQEFVNGNEDNYGWKITDENYWGMPGIPRMYFRTKEYESYIPYLEIHINEAPAAPTIIGPTSGTAGESYDYTFIAFDPEDEDIYYYIEWGDDTNTGWLGPYESGEQIVITYTWTAQGIYEIRAKAKDIHDVESDWGTLEVTMPVNQQVINPLLQMLLERFPNAFLILRQVFGL